METLDHHNLIHNDIKPQNYLVKYLTIFTDPARIEIVLTDFGLAGSDSKGGTPIFASPECLADPDRKDKSTDIFSLGRVFLFIMLPKEKFLEFLFVPLIKGGKKEILEMITDEPILILTSKMMQIKNRIGLQDIRKDLDAVSQKQHPDTTSTARQMFCCYRLLCSYTSYCQKKCLVKRKNVVSPIQDSRTILFKCISDISQIVEKSTSEYTKQYIDNLKPFS